MTTINLSIKQDRVAYLGSSTTQYFVFKFMDDTLYIFKDRRQAHYFELFATVNVEHPSTMCGSQTEIDSDIIDVIYKALEKRDDVVVNDAGVLFAK